MTLLFMCKLEQFYHMSIVDLVQHKM